MAAYEYVALDTRGKEQRGILEADSVRQIRQTLRDRGLTPLQVASTAESNAERQGAPALDWWAKLTASRFSALDRALVMRQLATLIGAGIPIEETLSAVGQQASSRRIRNTLMSLRSRVLEGRSLASAMADYPSAFPEMFRATVSAGEQSGYLDQVLESLAEYSERSQESRQNVTMALVYPVIISVVALAIVAGLLIFVVPTMRDVFSDAGEDLPLITRMVWGISEFLQQWFVLIILGGIALGWVMTRRLRQPEVQLRWHKRLLGWPIVGGIARANAAAQLSSTLSMLSSSGVPLVDALKIAAEVMSNRFLRERVRDATQRVSEGSSLSKALSEVRQFPPLMMHMVASGEISGELDKMLARVATQQGREVERVVTLLVRLFEPLMLLFMGVIVLSIVLATMLPILQANEMLGI